MCPQQQKKIGQQPLKIKYVQQINTNITAGCSPVHLTQETVKQWGKSSFDNIIALVAKIDCTIYTY